MNSLPGRPYHTGSWKEKSSWWDGLTCPCFSPEAPEMKRFPPSPNSSSSWEGLLYFQYPGPFLESLTGVWFMFPNSLPFLLTPHSDEPGTHPRNTAGAWKIAAGQPWTARPSYISQHQILVSLLTEESWHLYGENVVLIKACRHTKPISIYICFPALEWWWYGTGRMETYVIMPRDKL